MSHDVSHFAAFFIVVGAKTSIAESVDFVNILQDCGFHAPSLFPIFVIRFNFLNHFWLFKRIVMVCQRGVQDACRKLFQYVQGTRRSPPPERGRNSVEKCGNDPSAGSPTETLLRLHLPLNSEV